MTRTRIVKWWLIGVMVAAGIGLAGPAAAEEILIRDVCCFDLAGGGQADDGVLVLARGGTEVLLVVVPRPNTPR